jgi:hypothetical protein
MWGKKQSEETKAKRRATRLETIRLKKLNDLLPDEEEKLEEGKKEVE